jgi:alpha-beta hydrolase superfamily lysophospholipase
MAQTSQIPFTARDGQNLAVIDWALNGRQKPRGVVLIVHGLGEHAWRYNPLAVQLNEWGFSVRAYDQRGHGDSAGKRGCIPASNTLLKDLADVLDDTRSPLGRHARLPVILLGHSMGGLVAALYVARHQTLRRSSGVDSLVLSSPAFDVGLKRWQRKLLALMRTVAPNLTFAHRLDPHLLTQDPQALRAFLSDPRVHDRVSPRLARFIAVGGSLVLTEARRWATPTLLMYSAADAIVNPAGSRRFAAAVPEEVLQTRDFENLCHELFNEIDTTEVTRVLRKWLDKRY